MIHTFIAILFDLCLDVGRVRLVSNWECCAGTRLFNCIGGMVVDRCGLTTDIICAWVAALGLEVGLDVTLSRGEKRVRSAERFRLLIR